MYFKYLFPQSIQESYCLNGLSQAHFISQYGICALRPRETQPVQSLQLIRMQFPTVNAQILGLLFQLFSQKRFLGSIVSLRFTILFFFLFPAQQQNILRAAAVENNAARWAHVAQE